jgi:hypothetical protein
MTLPTYRSFPEPLTPDVTDHFLQLIEPLAIHAYEWIPNKDGELRTDLLTTLHNGPVESIRELYTLAIYAIEGGPDGVDVDSSRAVHRLFQVALSETKPEDLPRFFQAMIQATDRLFIKGYARQSVLLAGCAAMWTTEGTTEGTAAADLWYDIVKSIAGLNPKAAWEETKILTHTIGSDAYRQQHPAFFEKADSLFRSLLRQRTAHRLGVSSLTQG